MTRTRPTLAISDKRSANQNRTWCRVSTVNAESIGPDNHDLVVGPWSAASRESGPVDIGVGTTIQRIVKERVTGRLRTE